MNKNTLLAVLLILISVLIFNSETYNKFFYEKIYPKKPYIEKNAEKEKKAIEQQSVQNQEIKKDTLKEQQILPKNDSTIALSDSIKSDTVWIETDKMIMGISEKGAVIVSVKMKDFKYTENKNGRLKGELIDLLPPNKKAGSQLIIQGVNYDNCLFKCNENKKEIKIEGNGEKEIIFTCYSNNEVTTKAYVLKNDTYKIGLNIGKNDLSGKKIDIGWNSGIEESEQSKQLQQDIRTVHYSDGKTVQHLQKKKGESESITGNFKWVGVTSKYFFVSIVNNNENTDNDADITVQSFPQSDENVNKKSNIINYSIGYSTIAQQNVEKFWFYLGPNSYHLLKKYNLGFEKILFPVLGWSKWLFFSDKWFPSLAEAVLWVLLSLFNFVKDYGIAIFLLTFLTKLVTYPLMASSMKSMNKMKVIQPKIQAMRDKYKNNPKKMNEELMNLYKKEGINPLNPGCLPMFLQMPIFIALFVVLRKAIELRGAETMFIPWIHDLSKAEMLFQLPWNIPMYGSNFAILPIVMAILTYFQNKMTIKDPNQKAMIYFMPIFMLALFNSFASGLVLYWTLSSAFAIIQQIITDKQLAKAKK